MQKIKCVFMWVAVICLMGILGGCATSRKSSTNEDFKRESKSCYDKAYEDQRTRISNWFSRYLDCRREHVMPIEVFAYGQGKEAEVRKIYEEMYKIAPLVDSGKMPVKAAYERWDQMTAERLHTNCMIKVEQHDGGDHCVAVQSIRGR